MASEYEDQMALMEYLLAQGINPFGMSDQDVDLYNWSNMPEDSDEWGTLEAQNDRLTMANKANNYISDPATIAQLGATTGGYSLADFQPITYYEPVNIPGRQRLAAYMQSADPVARFIAEAMSDGHTSNSAVMLLQTALKDPAQAEELLPFIPKNTIDSPTGGTIGAPDFTSIQKMAADLEAAQLTDDPWDGVTVDPKTGAPSRAYEEESEASRYFRETGLPNPYERYDPNTLATPEQLGKESQAKQNWQSASQAVAPLAQASARASDVAGDGGGVLPSGGDMSRWIQKGRALFDTAMARRDEREQQRRGGLADVEEALGRSGQGAWGPLTDDTQRSMYRALLEGDDGGIGFDSFQTSSSMPSRGLRGARQSSFINDARVRLRGDERRRQDEEAAARFALREGQIKAQRAWEGREAALWEGQRRKDMTEAMWRAGLSPFGDVMRARQANTYGY